MKLSGLTAPLLLLTLVALPAPAADLAPSWETCAALRGKTTEESELECYRKLAEPDRTSGGQVALMKTRRRGLINEWQPAKALLSVYKQNYLLLFSRTSRTNTLPTSPNPQNQVLIPSMQDDRALKFQFSMKHDLADFGSYGSLWFGYTQLSFWQLYDAPNSRPFRENNYEPELIYSLRPDELMPNAWHSPWIMNFGLMHQSNGQPNPRSRSWNRVYIQPGLERDFEHGRSLILLARFWQKIGEPAVDDDNPDITDYLGHGELELRFSLDRKWEATAIARSRSFQLDLAAPWDAIRLLTLAVPGEHNTNIHLQYFNGYGESLIDYNHRHTTWGAGLSFPFD